MKIILAFLIPIMLLSSCHGQKNKSENLLSNGELGKTVAQIDSNIWAIFQDSKNSYWLGSNGNGVFQVSNNKIIQFTSEHGLCNNTIRGFQEDEKGNILIETQNGVCKFDGTKFTNIEIIRSESNKWMLEEHDLWFNCNAGFEDVLRYDGDKLYELKLPRQDLTKVLHSPDINFKFNPYVIYGIDKDSKGNVWFGTESAAAFRFDGNQFLWIGEKELSVLEDGRVPGVRSILEDQDGNMWLSNFISKYKMDGSGGYEKITTNAPLEEIDKHSLPYFNAGLKDHDGNLWMVTYGGGVWRYNGKELDHFPVTKNDSTIYLMTIHQDNNNFIWLGTQNDGVYRWDRNGFSKYVFGE